jgi:LssY C-terminus
MKRRALRHDGRPAMRGWSVKKLWACVGIVTLGCFTPLSITAQLVREEALPLAAAVPTQNPADAPAGKSRVSQEIQLTGDQHWVDSGLDVKAGERVILTASGTLRYADAPDENGPEGRARGWRDLLKILPLNEAGRGAVLARIGDADSGQPFAVNQRRELTSRAAGRLFLGINQAGNDSAQGTYRVRVEIYAATAGAPAGGVAVAREVAQIRGVDANLFSKIPRRNGDKDGNPGDMVNFLIIGSEPGMQRAFELAGWVKVDRTKKDAVLHGILSSISKESYVQMPMSELYLFGRPQDYGFAHAEPLVVVAQRHHLRIWKAPFQVNGQTVWAGAATHDIGFERDKRNKNVTHKIDPDVDAERDYVGKTLSETGLVAERAFFLPSDALTEAKTATGGSFHSNGKILILKLGDTDGDLSADFAQTFCDVLEREKSDSGGWGACRPVVSAIKLERN